jgi:hypothetical protein
MPLQSSFFFFCLTTKLVLECLFCISPKKVQIPNSSCTRELPGDWRAMWVRESSERLPELLEREKKFLCQNNEIAAQSKTRRTD